MFSKLALRNVKRSAKDYLVYVTTMVLVTALMFAFNSLLFSPDIRERVDEVGIMAAMIGLATFFIVIITAWLINYMVRFMLEKRSREFGTYLLLGMKKKEIARLYMRENMILGAGAFFLGLGFGIFLQQVVMAVLYAMIQDDYHLHLQFSFWCILTTSVCYAGCYVLALFRCRRRFRKMNIRDLMEAGRRNEEVKESHEQVKKWLFPAGLVFLALFSLWLFSGGRLIEWNGGTLIGFIVGLVLVIYIFYIGLSSAIVCYIRKGGGLIYKNQNLFLFRQLSSKLKTMWFTMGTLTSLFTVAFLGCTVAMMFSDYQNKMLTEKFPFDVQVYSGETEKDFEEQIKSLEENTEVKSLHSYCIYTDGTNQVNVWLRTHLRCFGDTYLKKDGTPDIKKIEENADGCYCREDTYMKLSDYNYLRKMLGYKEISLGENEYALHLKKRVYDETGDFSDALTVKGPDGRLSFAGYYTEPFSQDGHNGGDYVIVVPDSASVLLKPYYSELAADLAGAAPAGLAELLDDTSDYEDSYGYSYMGEDAENSCCGSDQIIVMSVENVVRDNLIPEIRYMLSSIIFPCFYMGLVFVCAALTVLSVQQLSDSAKYKFRYSVLHKIGLGRREIVKVIRKQLFGYYLCPVLFSAVIAGIIALFISRNFILYTGISTPVIQYYGIAFLLFFGIYTLYFITTYAGFRRNVESEIGH